MFASEASAPFDGNDAESRLAWLRSRTRTLERIPLPGHGLTGRRLRVLAELATIDGALARLVEGHLDALAILDELGVPATDPTMVRGVWAARPDGLTAAPTRDGWVLRGEKPWCSGAAGIDRALVTATDPNGAVRLFDVDVDALTFADDWHPMGMQASDSRTAHVDIVVPPDAQVGGPGSYVGRPGFWHGGVGVAACWHGLAQRLADDLVEHADRRPDPYLDVARGHAVAAVTASTALLSAAAREIDEHPGDGARAMRRARVVRVAVARLTRDVLETSMRAEGATALSFDARHARAVADCAVYLGQLHDGRDAASVEDHRDDDWWTS